MNPNLLFYGSGFLMGLMCSVVFWHKEERSKGLLIALIAIPLLWTLIVAAGKETMDLKLLYDINHMNYSYPQNKVIFWMVPVLEVSLLFGAIWIEKNRIKARAYQGTGRNGDKPRTTV